MSALLDVYRAQFNASLAIWLQYRAGMLIWFFVRMVEPIIYISVWSSIANSQGGSLNGLSPQTFAAYYTVLMVVNQFTFVWMIGRYEQRIRSGSLSAFLLKPAALVHRDMADTIANKFVTLSFVLPAVVIMIVLFHPVIAPPAWAVLAFLAALLSAFLLRFLVDTLVAMLAFWTTRVDAVDRMYFVLLFFFSGRLAPLDLLPAFWQSVANALPFRWILAFPTDLLLGRLSPEQALGGFAAQGVWLALAGLCLPGLWKTSLRHYAAVEE